MAAGGARHNAGRPKKEEVLKLVERLKPMDDEAFEALHNGVRAGKYEFIKLYMEYRFGKPKEQLDITSGGNELQQWTMIPAKK